LRSLDQIDTALRAVASSAQVASDLSRVMRTGVESSPSYPATSANDQKAKRRRTVQDPPTVDPSVAG